jgi:branched-chain amino acid transport system permease protein
MWIQLLVSGVSMGSIYALVALSMAILVSAVNVVNFAAGDFVMFGAFLIVTTAMMWHFPYAIALVLSVLLMGVLGYVFYRLAYYPLRRRGFLPIMISTVGCSLAFQNIAQIVWGAQPISADPPLGFDLLKFGQLTVQPQYVFILAVTALALIFQYLLFERLPIGRRLRAVAQDPDTASLMGVHVQLMVAITFMWAAALGGLSGLLFAPVFFVSTTMGMMVGLKAFAALVIGGWGSIVGAILGGMFVGIAETYLAAYVSSVYKDAFVFLILILFLLVRPRGIMGERTLERV